MSNVVNWDETCSKCIYGTLEELRSNAKGKCTHKYPLTHFDIELGKWVCDTFKRRWDTQQDLELSRQDAQTVK